MCLAQGPQRSDAGEALYRGPSVSSQALYHSISSPYLLVVAVVVVVVVVVELIIIVVVVVVVVVVAVVVEVEDIVVEKTGCY